MLTLRHFRSNAFNFFLFKSLNEDIVFVYFSRYPQANWDNIIGRQKLFRSGVELKRWFVIYQASLKSNMERFLTDLRRFCSEMGFPILPPLRR